MEIENITFIEYVNLKDKSLYNYASNFSRKLNQPKDLFNVGKFSKLTFGQVKDAQYSFNSGVHFENLIKFTCYLKKIKEIDFCKKRFFDICKYRRFIELELDNIYKAEKELYYESSAKDESAGIDKLSKFGVIIQIDQLANGDVTKYEQVKKQPYALCFNKLLMNKEIELYKFNKHKQK